MNNRYIHLLVAFFLLIAGSCSDEPQFPDPGFDLLSDKNFTVRRDTAESFTIRLNVKAPAGINVIQILDGRTYTLEEEIDNYKNQQEFLFQHDIDFSDMDKNKDTVLIKMVRIVANDNRAFNSSFKINLKKLSFPEIQLTSQNDVIGTTVPVVGLNGLVTTGIYKLASVKVFIEGKECFSVPSAELSGLSEYNLAANIAYDFKKGETYRMAIEATDERGEKCTKNLAVKGIEMKKVKQIRVDRKQQNIGSYFFEYNGEERICKIVYENPTDPVYNDYTVTFDYGANGMVSRVVYWYHHTDYLFTTVYIDFKYEGTKLIEARHGRHPWGEPENTTLYETFQHIVYREDGTIQNFDSDINTIKEVYYADGFIPGEKIFAEKWNGHLNAMQVGSRKIKTGFVPILMPSYIEGLPPVFCMRWIGEEMMDLCWYKYLATAEAPGTGNTEPPTTTYRQYTYTCDENGQLLTFTRKEYASSDYWYDYNFQYE